MIVCFYAPAQGQGGWLSFYFEHFSIIEIEPSVPFGHWVVFFFITNIGIYKTIATLQATFYSKK
jgi:hypothetical protein